MAFELQSKVCTFFFMLHVFWLQKLDEELKNEYIFINISYIELCFSLESFYLCRYFWTWLYWWMLKGTCWITLNPRLIEGPCQLYTDFTLISQLTRLFLAINYIFLGFKCCRPCAVWEYSSSKGKEVAEELQEMDVHGHNYPSHYCCNHCCWCAEAMEQQQRCLEFLEFCVGIFTCINTDTYCIVLYSYFFPLGTWLLLPAD